jgi:uridine kinase
MRKRVIGITGGSCSGKTSLAEGLAEAIGRPSVLVLGLDSYYKDFSGVPEHEIDVDVPEALDHDLIIEQLQSLKAGRQIGRPVYDYATHSRRARAQRVEPRDTIIVEGLFTLFWSNLRDLIDLGVYVDADHDTCLARRVARDTRERGRTEESVRRRYRELVEPNYEMRVLPTRAYADMVLSGLEPVDDLVRAVIARIDA